MFKKEHRNAKVKRGISLSVMTEKLTDFSVVRTYSVYLDSNEEYKLKKRTYQKSYKIAFLRIQQYL